MLGQKRSRTEVGLDGLDRDVMATICWFFGDDDDRPVNALRGVCKRIRCTFDATSLHPYRYLEGYWLDSLACAPATVKPFIQNLFVQLSETPLVDFSVFKRITHLAFCRKFNQEWSSFALPDTLVSLRIATYIDQPVVGWKLPHGLKELLLNDISGAPLGGTVSSWLQPRELIIASWFDSPVIGWELPSTLEHLAFGAKFDQPVIGWKLPDSLVILEFDYSFNQPVIGWNLPSSLDVLAFSRTGRGNFNQPVVGWKLPASLKRLIIGSRFNQPVVGWELPSSMVYLLLPRDFKQLLEDWILPASLKYIHIGTESDCVRVIRGRSLLNYGVGTCAP